MPESIYGGIRLPLRLGTSLEDYSLFCIGNKDSQTLKNILLRHPTCSGHVYDPATSTCTPLPSSTSKFLMKRYVTVEKVKDAGTIGILVGTMGMEGYLKIIKHLKNIIKLSGKKSYTFVVGKLNAPKLANFIEIDIFVFVACPEETFVDTSDYYKPIATPFEVEMACNANRDWGDAYVTDFRELLPGGKHFREFSSRSTHCDVSLLSGKLRTLMDDKLIADSKNAIELKNKETALAIFHPFSSARFYAERTWKGLEQNLGETAVVSVKKGRSGLPISYSHELMDN